MALLQAARTQVLIWTAYSRLNASEVADRRRAIRSFVEIGSAALPCLRFASGPVRPPRVQYSAAVAMHLLGDTDGMALLCSALRWHLPARPELQSEIEAAFLEIGAPDAVSALIDLFPRLPARDPLIMGCLCNLWHELRDPRALDVLTGPYWQLPELFVVTVPGFGLMAIGPLEQMTLEPDQNRRLLAINALRNIPAARSLDVLRPMLHDPDPQVRGAIPAAMCAIDPAAAIGAVARAVRDGYSTREAIDLLARNAGTISDLLIDLVSRWYPQVHDDAHDTRDAVMAAIPLLIDSQMSNSSLFPPLCALLDRRPDSVMTAAIARLLAVRLGPGQRPRAQSTMTLLVRDTLSTRITDPDKEVRLEVSQALERAGEPLGRELNQWLSECWPQGNLLARLHTILRGGPDAGQAATQAMQQVTQWFHRLSREAADRLSTGGPLLSAPTAAGYDPRLPEALRQTLRNSLASLRSDVTDDCIAETVALSTAALRALERIGPPNAMCAYDEIVEALHTVKYSQQHLTPGARPGSVSERREIGEMVRAAAASLLLQLLGTDGYGVFLCALYAPQQEVHRTAMLALSRLGDPRALPHLQVIATDSGHPDNVAAQEAIATIRRTNPEVMTLLRASNHGNARPDTLLRPATGNNVGSSSDLLLRPTTVETELPSGAATEHA
jgi:HEAT repeat protein